MKNKKSYCRYCKKELDKLNIYDYHIRCKKKKDKQRQQEIKNFYIHQEDLEKHLAEKEYKLKERQIYMWNLLNTN